MYAQYTTHKRLRIPRDIWQEVIYSKRSYSFFDLLKTGYAITAYRQDTGYQQC